MADPISKAEAARRRDVSAPAVSQALRHGQLVQTADGKIDPDHPLNKHWLESPARIHPKRTARKDREAGEKKGPGRKPRTADDMPKGIPGVPDDFDPAQKLYEETRWKKAQADMKSLEYAEKLGVMNDDRALDKKFGAFIDFLLNDLIYFSEESSDILWAEAAASDEPARTLENALKKRVAAIIEGAQAAAREVQPSGKSVSYIFSENDEQNTSTS
jgi:hypothetical protein